MKVLADFKKLTSAEEKLVKWLQAGNRKFFRVSDSVPDGPSDAVTLRATFLRYLALGGCDTCRLPETGLQVAGAYILGDEKHSENTKGLDFEGATLPHDLGLWACQIPDPIILRSAKVKNLFLNRSEVKADITADRLLAEGSVFLREAKIAGEVRLLGARLDDLSCDGAALHAKGEALRCDGMQAEGSVFLHEAKIAGAVRLLGARLGGDLVCEGAELQAKGMALICDGMQTQGGVFLRGVKIAGETRLRGARLGGTLECDGAELKAKGTALNCAGAKIAGAFFLRRDTTVSGRIDLTDASLGSICDDPACWPDKIELDRCRYGAFLGNDAPTDADMRLKWLALQKPRDYSQDFSPDPYEHCAKVLREMGYGADATKILIEKERLQRLARREREARELSALRDSVAESLEGTEKLSQKTKVVFGAGWLWVARKWDRLLGFLVGYGRKPLDALWRGLLPVWAIGTIIFFLASWTGEIKPNLPQTQVHPAWVECAEWGARRWQSHATQVECFRAQPEGQSYPHFNALFYSADTLFPVVALEMQSYWIPDDTKPFGKYARWYLWAHIIAGWALTLLAVAGFSGLIKTDNTK
ncbi:MAG: hypothetical protein JJU07_14975 [Natronohydrobacter sp.]|nr:hypothetical protein [Natronohydrobacter sp.]